jgi:membrane-associated phospholipid phosphatase
MIVRYTRTLLILSFLILAKSYDARGQYIPTNEIGYKQDSIVLEQTKKTFFQHDAVRIGLPPAIFFAASAATWGSREKIREIRNRYIPTFRHHYDDYMQYMPAVSVYALNLSGVKGRNKLGRATISYAASALIMGIIVNSVKYTAKVERPDGSKANSFPSGHTSNAFMNATFMHKEFGHINPIYSIAGYSMSTFTGVGRGLNNRHWISDVLAGAGIGILSTQLGYFFINKFYKNQGDRPSDLRFDNPLNKPSYLSLKVGYASSMRNLVENFDIGIKSKAGFEAGLEGAYYFTEHWGLGGDFSFVSFPISTSESTISDPDLGNSSSSVVTQSMGALNFTIGPHYTYEITPDWLLQAKIGAGIMVGATGKVSLKFEDADTDDNILNDESDLMTFRPARAFKVNGGLAITRMLNTELGITAYTDYHHSKPVFTYEGASDPTDPNLPHEIVKEKNEMSYITAGLRLTAFF